MIKYQINDEEIIVSLPSSMKDIFKKTFKTCRWDGNLNAWVLDRAYEAKFDELLGAIEHQRREYEEKLREVANTPLSDEEKGEFQRAAASFVQWTFSARDQQQDRNYGNNGGGYRNNGGYNGGNNYQGGDRYQR